MDSAPFNGSAALSDGLVTRAELRREYRRIYRDVYVGRDQEVDAAARARAAWVFAQGKAVVAGPSAAALHGSRWIPVDHIAELIWSEHRQPYSRIRIRSDVLPDDEVETLDGILVTTAARTAFDLGRRGSFAHALGMVDALCNATDLHPRQISLLADKHRGSRGIVQLRQLLDVADGGAESPQESRTRLAMLDAGLPRPTTQIEVRGFDGVVFARLDIGCEEWKVAVEYDGEHHWADEAQRAWDIERMHQLQDVGWTVFRVSAQTLRTGTSSLVTRIRQALLDAGAPL